MGGGRQSQETECDPLPAICRIFSGAHTAGGPHTASILTMAFTGINHPRRQSIDSFSDIRLVNIGLIIAGLRQCCVEKNAFLPVRDTVSLGASTGVCG